MLKQEANLATIGFELDLFEEWQKVDNLKVADYG